MPLALMPTVNAAQDASNEALGAVWISKALAETSVLMGVLQIPQNIEEISAAIFILLLVLLLTVGRKALPYGTSRVRCGNQNQISPNLQKTSIKNLAFRKTAIPGGIR